MLFRLSIFSLWLLPSLLGATDFGADVQPYLKENCFRCHGPEKQKGDLRLDTLSDDFSDGRTASIWIEVRDNINLGEMPPDDEPRPNSEKSIAVSQWIAGELRSMQARANSTGGRVQLRRLSRTEYINTVRDLLKIDFEEGEGPREILPPDGNIGGFDKVSKALLLDPSLMDNYFAAASFVADRAVRVLPNRVKSVRHRYEFETIPTSMGIGYLAHSRSVDILDDGILLYGGGARTGGQPKHPYNGEQIPVLGRYTVRVRAGANRGTIDEPVYLEMRRNQGLSKRFEVRAPIDRPEVYEWTVAIDPAVNGEWSANIIPGTNFQHYNGISGGLRTAADKLVQDGDPREAIRLRAQARAEGIFTDYSQDRPNLDAKDKTTLPYLYLDYFEIEGPHQEPFPPASTRYIYPNGFENPDELTPELVRSIFSRLLPRAFRRPVHDGEVEAWTALVEEELESGQSFHEAIKTGLTAMLCSPDFLLLFEPGAAGEPATDSGSGESGWPIVRLLKKKLNTTKAAAPDLRSLNDYEVASRLSYFLWSSMPDDELFELAAGGKLTDPETLDSQVARMLGDPKAEALVSDFATQWMQIDEFDQFKPDESIYRDSYYAPQFAGLAADLEEEARSFFREILTKDESVLNFLDSEWIMANEKLAAYYGLDGPKGESFQRVALPADSPRGGIIGMAGFHKWGADGNRTKPVERGKYILNVLFNDPPDPPPPNAGEVEPNIQGERLTVRDRLLRHQEVEACAGCHRTIDPYGLAMENFNVVGLWRDVQDGESQHFWSHNPPPIINEGTLPNGVQYSSFSEFKAALAAQGERFERGLAERMFVYALGRLLEPGDHTTIENLVAEMGKNGHTLRSLIHGIVRTQAFLTK